MAAKDKGIKLITKVQAPSPVYGDMYRIKQCIMNLISNSINYTTAGGSISVEYEKFTYGVTLRVRDDGVGIPREDLPHIFERFYRVDKSRSHINGGMGIGLSITKAIVEAHEGTISVDSIIGSGSVFTVFLPDGK